MALEDFTTYTEVDPNARIAVTANRVTWASLQRDEDAYVYIDKTANYFAGNFKINVTHRITTGANSGLVYFCTMTNLVDDWKGIDDALGDALGVFSHKHDTLTTYHIGITEVDGGASYSSTQYTVTVDTDYYLTLTRDETVGTYGTLYLYIYSDVARTTLLDTLTLALHDKIDFRYFYACQSYNSAQVNALSGYSEALEIVYNVSSPTVTIQPCSSIVTTTATGHGTITSLGSSPVTEHGHCWAETIDPTTANSKTTKGAGVLGAFTSSITGLTPGLAYYVRAYATNSTGTSYSGNVLFRAGLPSIQVEGNQIAVGNTVLLYSGRNGKRYYIQGVQF